jgi:hypothetical protein
MFRHPQVPRLGLALLFAAAAACGDANILPPASLAVRDDTITLWALTGTNIQFPSAYDLVLGIAARTDRTPDFDLAFDFVYDSLAHDTVPALLPRGALGLSADGGLLRVATRFDSLYAAPGSGYDAIRPVFLDTTTVVVVRSRTQICNFGISSGLYAKLQPLAISRTFRKLIMRMVTDPNCGYHSLQPGVPGS